jgi:hypothetical protein
MYHKIDNPRLTENLEEPCDMNGSLKETEEQWFMENRERFSLMPFYKRPSRPLIYFVMTVYSFSFTILMGPLMILMLESICKDGSKMMKRMDMGGGMGGSSCKNPDSQKVLSDIQTVLSMISGFLGFSLSGRLGQLSDIRGRIFVLRIFAIINVLHTLGLIAYFKWYGGYDKFFMILVNSIGYFTGGVMTLISVGNSYLNDIVPDHERTISISWLMSSVYITLGVGPLLGSVAIKATDNDSVVLYMSMVAGTIFLLLVLNMTETRHPEAMVAAREKLDFEHNVSTCHEKKVWSTLILFYKKTISYFRPIKRLWLDRTPLGSVDPRVNIIILILVDLVNMAATVGTMHVIILYAVLKFEWKSVEIGYYMSINGFGRAFVLLVIAPLFLSLLLKGFRMRTHTEALDYLDKTSIVISLTFVIASCLTIIIWDSAKGVYLSAVLQSLSGMVSPTIQGAVIKYSSKTTSGEMFGAIALVRHLAMLILPVTFLQIYSHTVDYWPKFFLYLPLVGSVTTLLLSLLFLKPSKGEQ